MDLHVFFFWGPGLIPGWPEVPAESVRGHPQFVWQIATELVAA
jgi:hypothetical protein